MSNPIKFTYSGVNYTLEFTRKSIKLMEKNGLSPDFQNKMVTSAENLFRGAFFANHKYTNEKLIGEIYENMPRKGDLNTRLAELYSETLTVLYDSEAESSEETENENFIHWE